MRSALRLVYRIPLNMTSPLSSSSSATAVASGNKTKRCVLLKLPTRDAVVPNGPNNYRTHADGDCWTTIINTAVRVLQEGGVIGVPTDTIYGLACLAQNSKSIKNMYNMKGRNGSKPLAICVGNIEDIYRYCHVNVPDQLLRDLLPGPVTLVLQRSQGLNPDLNPFTSVSPAAD